MTTTTAAANRDRSRADGYSAALQRLGSAQKSAKGAPAYSRFVNRRLGRYLAALAYVLGLTPNTVTAISGAFSFAGIAVLALVAPSWWVGIIVMLCLVIGYALDSADGQLARLRGGGSTAGEWLDHMIDATKISSLHLAVLIAAYRWFEFDSAAWLLVPIGFTVVAAVSFFGMILNDQLQRAHQVGKPPAITAAGAPSTLRSLLVAPTDYGVLCLSFLLLGAPPVFFAVYCVLFAGSLGYLLLAAVKWFRVMQGLDARPPGTAPGGAGTPSEGAAS